VPSQAPAPPPLRSCLSTRPCLGPHSVLRSTLPGPDDDTTVFLSRRAYSPALRQTDLLPTRAVPPSRSTDNRIKLVRCAFQKQSVMQTAGIRRSLRRSNDGQTILRFVRVDPDLYPDLLLLRGRNWVRTSDPSLVRRKWPLSKVQVENSDFNVDLQGLAVEGR